MDTTPSDFTASGGIDLADHGVTTEAERPAPFPTGDSLSWEPLLGRPNVSAPTASPTAPAGPANDAAAASKIRDILFGQHMAEYERRFTQLESRLARELDDIRREGANRSESLQNRLSQDVANLGRLLDNERKERVKEASQLTDDIRSTRQEFEVAVDKASRDAEAAVVHLRHALQEETDRQRRALEERTESIERQLDAVATGLRKDKVDRSSLQVLFEQLSVHFGADGPRGGAAAFDGQE